VCCILPLNVRHCAYSTLVKRRVVNMFRRNQISGKGRKFPVQKVGLSQRKLLQVEPHFFFGGWVDDSDSDSSELE
jgi:hypothetical protein